ncbi:uncharacterized protein RSE6_14405 [Rhynchosporium secalis]|uniref:Uncharacterized protein n=1 Tax=Rhynchosporium secalis TaxID=38038 RepID=A0A1E1MV90_RHYSE|nr:uncharacterized protein RSE6_14405 [Rhynchosporium secalis]
MSSYLPIYLAISLYRAKPAIFAMEHLGLMLRSMGPEIDSTHDRCMNLHSAIGCIYDEKARASA